MMPTGIAVEFDAMSLGLSVLRCRPLVRIQ